MAPGVARLAAGGAAAAAPSRDLTVTSSSQLLLPVTTRVAAIRSPSRTGVARPRISNAMLIAGISPSHGVVRDDEARR